jgi:hypothetical protein
MKQDSRQRLEKLAAGDLPLVSFLPVSLVFRLFLYA